MRTRSALLPLAIPVLALALAPAKPAAAQDVLGTFGAWTAFSEKTGGKLTCYVGAKPKKMEGKYTSRDPAYLLVSHRPAEKVRGEVSLEAGFTFKSGSEPVVAIGPKTFKLFSKGSNAWATDATADKQLVQAMKTGNDLVVKGISARGTATTDTYSLGGFSAALAAIDKACGG
ncbi:MAG: invasion associated locus B family protein [Rhodospirillales bacterium]